MKSIKQNINYIIVLVLLLASCTDLDETVYSDITAEETTLTAEDLQSIVVPAYASFRKIYWGWDGYNDVNEDCSDLIVTPARIGIGWGDYYINMHMHTWRSGTSDVEANWSYLYEGINLINRSIYQIELLEDAPEEDKTKYINEVRGLRALYYYILLDLYRSVPIETEYDVPDGYLPEQNSAEEVFDFIESELTDIMSTLSEENTAETYGTFTKWAAKMALAKLYLNAQVFIGEEHWSDAQEQVQDIIDSEKFSLEDDYSYLFSAENEDSKEEILSIPYDYTYGAGNYYPFKTLHPASQATFDMNAAPWGGSGAIPQFIDTYDEDDQRLTDSWLGGLQYSSSGEAIMVDGEQLDYINYMTEVDGTEYNEGYRLVKAEIVAGNEASYSNDVEFYRYTDALMIKAECLLRTGKEDEAAAIVTVVRERDFADTDPDKAQVTGAELKGGSTYEYGKYSSGVITSYEGGDDIEYGRFLDELAWEFVGEAHRRNDLIRFGVFTSKSWFSHEPNGSNRSIFPIPQSAMETNSNLVQNPGY